MPQPTRDQVFISYSHKDYEWLERLQTMLKPLMRKKLAVWDDTKINAGAKWKDEIQGALAAAKVIDTSFRSVEDAGKYQGLTCQRSEKQTLEAQLARFEIGLEDVGYIIHTHVHMDHAGQDYLFPNAKIILQRGELQHAAAPNVCPVLFYDRLDVSRLTNELWSQLEFIEGGNSEPFPGIRCEFTPGHTPFHQMVRIDTAAGEYVVAGDAAMLLSNVTNQWMPGIIDSMSGTMTGLKKLQPIVDRVLPTHDRVVAERFSHGIG